MDNGDGRARVIERKPEGIEILLERRIHHAPATIWYMLTDPEALPRWLAPGTVEARAGGRASIDFGDSGATIDSTVRVCERERLLVYSWSSDAGPDRPLYWALIPVEEGTQLRLTLRLPADEDGPKAAAGWDAHLEMLLAALEGVPIRFPVDHFLAMRERFREQLAGEGEASQAGGERS